MDTVEDLPALISSDAIQSHALNLFVQEYQSCDQGKQLELLRQLSHKLDLEIMNFSSDRKNYDDTSWNSRSATQNEKMDIFADPKSLTVEKMEEWLHLEGSNINAQNQADQTLLHLGAIYGNVPVCKYLISKGANVNIKDVFKETCYHDACRHGNSEIVALLLEAGADTSIKASYYL
jgi:hypothetical protein